MSDVFADDNCRRVGPWVIRWLGWRMPSHKVACYGAWMAHRDDEPPFTRPALVVDERGVIHEIHGEGACWPAPWRPAFTGMESAHVLAARRAEMYITLVQELTRRDMGEANG